MRLDEATKQLLTTLADGQFHSGTALGNLLGISRTAIWKQIEKLKQLSIPIESFAGKGYQIKNGLDLLNIEEIKTIIHSHLKNQYWIEHQWVTDSTNNQAKQRIQQQSIHRHVFLAEMQTAGKGRRDRNWVSPFASSIYFSLGWRFAGGVAKIQGLSLLVAIALLEALRNLGFNGCHLKWPNDILWSDKKLAGILIEIHGDYSDYCDVIIGIGLNVNNAMEQMASVDRPWIDLVSIKSCAESDVPSRNQIIAQMIQTLDDHLMQFEEKGFSHFYPRWQTYDTYIGRPVKIEMQEKTVTGIYQGLDATTGALQLQTSHGLLPIFGGEVSLRL